jgi:hypothetical protein
MIFRTFFTFNQISVNYYRTHIKCLFLVSQTILGVCTNYIYQTFKFAMLYRFLFLRSASCCAKSLQFLYKLAIATETFFYFITVFHHNMFRHLRAILSWNTTSVVSTMERTNGLSHLRIARRGRNMLW